MGAHRLTHAASRVAAGETGAVADLFAALAILAETGNQKGAPAMFLLLSQTYIAMGQLDEARGALDTRDPIEAKALLDELR